MLSFALKAGTLESLHGRRSRLGWVVAIVVGLSAMAVASADHAHAQSGLEPPSVYSAVDQFGVDLTSGDVKVSSPTISVGPADGGLSFTATWDTAQTAWRYSTDGSVTEELAKPDPYCLAFYTVEYLGSSNIFQRESCGSSNFDRIDGYGTLVSTTGGFTYTARDGSIATYTGTTRVVRISSITKLNGEVITYSYGTDVSSVSNNRGYQIRIERGSGGAATVRAINNAVDACGLTAATCTYSQTWPTLTFQTSGNERWVADSLNRTTRVILSTTPGLARVVGVARPSQTSGSSITYTQSFVRSWGTVVTAVNDGLGTWNYSYESYCLPAPNPCDRPEDIYDLDVTVTDPNGNANVYNIYWSTRTYWDPALSQQLLRNPALASVRNGAGQTTLVNETGAGLNSVSYPEGNGLLVDRNDFGGITSINTIPKPGSGLTTTNTIVTYPDCAVQPVLCRLPSSVQDRRGNTTEFTYDAAGNLLTETLPPPASGEPRPQTRYAWQQQYAWYKQNGSATITQAATPIWVQVERSQCTGAAPCDGLATEVQSVTTYQVGSGASASNLLPVTVSSGAGDGSLTATTSTTYDAASNVLTVNGPLAGAADTTRYVYDVMRQSVGVIGPDPDAGGGRLFPATRTTYNADGQTTTVEQGTTLGQSNPAWAAFSPLQTATRGYTAQGRLSWDVTAAGTPVASLTDYQYDAAGRPICTALRMTYGASPSAACSPTPAGAYGPDRITHNSYDAADRLTQVQTGYGTTGVLTERLQAWTLNGKVDWIEDGSGNRSDYAYDGFDRLYRLYFPVTTVGAHAANASDFEEYGYDANDNPTSKRTRANTLFTTSFDTLNRVTSIDAPSGSNDVWYGYDNLNRRLSASHASGAPSCSTTAVCSTWDALSRQRTETTSLGTMTSDYDLAGRRTQLTWPDLFFVTYAYDLDDQMVLIRQAGVTDIAAYAYDNLGRRTATGRGNAVSTFYGYDAASRLTSLSHDVAGTSADVAYAYSHSPASQITTLGRSNPAYVWGGPSGSATYVNNGLNQAVSAAGATLSWSAQGNLIGDGTRTYTYDSANRLTGVGSSTLSYDPLDRLAQMVGTQGARYAYDGGSEIVALIPTGAPGMTRWVRGPWPDELVAAYIGGATTNPNYTLQDHQGSSIAITDAAGALIGSALAYDEYGQPRSGNGGRLMYTGQMWMPDFAAYHYKARAYRPDLGRFLQTDPVGYAQGLNLYAYVANDPVNGTDPDGRQVVTARERELAADGRVQDFWRSRRDRGDPIGDTSVQYGEGERRSLGVAIASAKLDEALMTKHDDSLVSQGYRSDLAGESERSMSLEAYQAARAERADIRVDLMNAHVGAVDSDMSGVPHFLSADQITDYHHDVFGQHDLPANTFGGTPVTGGRWESSLTNRFQGWCRGCDQ